MLYYVWIWCYSRITMLSSATSAASYLKYKICIASKQNIILYSNFYKVPGWPAIHCMYEHHIKCVLQKLYFVLLVLYFLKYAIVKLLAVRLGVYLCLKSIPNGNSMLSQPGMYNLYMICFLPTLLINAE